MTERFATTPFGGGRMSAAKFRRHDDIERRRNAVRAGASGNDTGRADKWKLLRALTEAKEAIGVSDRAIVVLEALLSFHQDAEIDGGNPLIVFPSNAELSLRSRGMAEATLRRHLANLVDAGLIVRRDSPNGKRYCQRGDGGSIENAFGFDLSPLALAASSIFEAAEHVRAEARAAHRLRGEMTIHLRDISKVLEAAADEKRPGAWLDFAMRLAPLSGRLGRRATIEELTRRRDSLTRLRAEVETAYLSALTELEMSGNARDSERHIQNSNTDSNFDKGSEKNKKQASADQIERMARLDDTSDGGAPERKGLSVPLGYFLSVCPDVTDYAPVGVRSWSDVLAVASLVRPMLGVSPDAWRRACAAMGDLTAAMTLAAILQRSHAIRSPGGYLRALTMRAENGRFSVLPMLAALERR
jgi:replication initiation protein RepC